MTLEQLVLDLATSQKLRDAGFSQDTAFSWYPITPSEEMIDTEGNVTGREPMAGDATEFVFMTGECNDAICAAPTAEEILRVMPVRTEIGERWGTLESYVSTMNDFSFYVGWQANHSAMENEDPWYGANKLSEAAAHAYLWWKKDVAG